MATTYFFTINDFHKNFFSKFSTSLLVSVNEACSHEHVFTWCSGMHLAANFMILVLFLDTLHWDILLNLEHAWLQNGNISIHSSYTYQ